MGSVDAVDRLDEGMIYIQEGRQWDSVRFHHTTQNPAQFKTCEFFIFDDLQVIFSDQR